MGLALAIRPNLILIAAAAFFWTALNGWRATLRLGIGVAPAIAGIAWFNFYLYGSPLISGYGRLESLYAPQHVSTNVSQFTTWMFETQTPIVAAAALFFVAPRWFDRAAIRFPRVLLGGVISSVGLSYLFYLPFDDWTYLPTPIHRRRRQRERTVQAVVRHEESSRGARLDADGGAPAPTR